MSSRQLVRFFFTTLFLGGLTAGVVGFMARWDNFSKLFVSFEAVEIIMTFIWLVGVGMIFSLISQAGFFAYLTIHRFGLGIFKGLWNAVQLVLIGFVLFDVVYVRYSAFGEAGGLMPYMIDAFVILAVALTVAYMKAKQTNPKTFVSALFFMTVVTVVEWVPVLIQNDKSWLYFMLVPLLVCNAYQLLSLHKINAKSKIELEDKKIKAKVREA